MPQFFEYHQNSLTVLLSSIFISESKLFNVLYSRISSVRAFRLHLHSIFPFIDPEWEYSFHRLKTRFSGGFKTDLKYVGWGMKESGRVKNEIRGCSETSLVAA